MPSWSTSPVPKPVRVSVYSPEACSRKIAQPLELVVPLKVPAPLPETPMPEIGVPAAFAVMNTRVPALGLRVPLGGAISPWMRRRLARPHPGQVTFEVIFT